MINHYWKSKWHDGQFICQTCNLPPKFCSGKITMGVL